MAIQDRAYIGTEMKFKVEITAAGFSMVDDDFTITLKRGTVTKTFEKSELVYNQDGFFLCFDTSEFGTGVVTAIIRAEVPDNDFEDGYRTEVYKMDFMIIDK